MEVCGQLHAAAALAPEKEPQNWSGRRGEEKNFISIGTQNSDPSAVQPVASGYIDCSIPAHYAVLFSLKMSLRSAQLLQNHSLADFE
jgi:hypothetical protein